MPGLTAVAAFGETKTVTEWSGDPRCSVGRMVLFKRLRNGWTEQEAVETPRLAARKSRIEKNKNRKRTVMAEVTYRRKVLEAKKQLTIERQIDAAIVAMNGCLTDIALRTRLANMSRQRRHQRANSPLDSS